MNIQSSHHNGLQAQIQSPIRHDLTLQAASRAIDPATGNYDVHYDHRPSGVDRRQIAFVNFIYDIPFLKDSSNQLLRSTVGGWQVSGIVTRQTGEPIHISEGGIQNCAQGANNDPVKCAARSTALVTSAGIIPNADREKFRLGLKLYF